MLDLDQFDTKAEQEAGIDVEIRGPDKRTLIGLTIRIAGPDSACQKAAVQEIMNERLTAESADPLSAADIETNTIKVLAAATLSWSPNPTFDGKEHACSADAAAALYRKYPFILEQVRVKAENRAVFTKGSA